MCKAMMLTQAAVRSVIWNRSVGNY